jgi:site-specific DNA recombinase
VEHPGTWPALGHLARCGSCGGRLAAKTKDIYRCCIQANREDMETLVTEVVIARLTDPKVFRKLRKASDGDDKIVLEAQAEVGRLTAELAMWRDSAVAGKTTPDSLAAIEAGITVKIREAQRRAEQAAIPPVARDLVGGPGGDVRARWVAAPLGARRDVIKTLMTVTLHGVTGRGPKVTDRVEIVWR